MLAREAIASATSTLMAAASLVSVPLEHAVLAFSQGLLLSSEGHPCQLRLSMGDQFGELVRLLHARGRMVQQCGIALHSQIEVNQHCLAGDMGVIHLLWAPDASRGKRGSWFVM